MPDLDWLVHLDTATLEAPTSNPMHLLLNQNHDEGQSRIKLAALYSNKAAKAHRNPRPRYQQTPPLPTDSTASWNLMQANETLSESSHLTSIDLQQQQQTNLPPNAFGNANDKSHALFSRPNFTFPTTLIDTHQPLMSSSDLWQRRCHSRSQQFSMSSEIDSSASANQTQEKDVWNNNPMDYSSMDQASNVKSSALNTYPFPGLISPSFQLLQQPPNWKKNGETYPRYDSEFFLIPESIKMLQSSSSVTTNTTSSGLGLSLETSPSFSNSEESMYSTREGQRTYYEDKQDEIDDTVFSRADDENGVITIGSKTNHTSALTRLGKRDMRTRSRWQIEEPQSANKKKRASIQSSKRTISFDDTEDSKLEEDIELRYECPHPTCQKDFSTSGHARRHSRIHTNLRPFICPHLECKSTFTRRDNCTCSGAECYVIEQSRTYCTEIESRKLEDRVANSVLSGSKDKLSLPILCTARRIH